MKVKSTLPSGDFYMHLAVMLDLVALVCVLTVVSSDITPRFGFGVRMPASPFLMDSIPGEKYIVAVAAGDDPVVFLNNRRLDKGLASLEEELDGIVEKHGEAEIGRVGVILVLDRTVSRATEQRLLDMIMTRNMLCSIATEPQE